MTLSMGNLEKVIKVYLDGADRESMLSFAKDPFVQGFTTNPSLMKKAGVTDYASYCKDLLREIKDKPISFEVFADDFKEMHRQAGIIHSWTKEFQDNVYVKIPIMNSEGKSSAELIRTLSHEGVRLNVTAVFTLNQVWDACLALKGGAPSIVSVFAGRIADSGSDPLSVMSASAAMCRETDPNIELLWASTREAYNFLQAVQTGCQIITAPADLIKKAKKFGRDAWDLSLDTVKTFKADSEAAGFTM